MHYRKEDKVKVVEEWTQSNLTQQAFCEQRDLSLSTFNCWKQKISRKRQGFVKIQSPLKPCTQINQTTMISIDRFQIELSGTESEAFLLSLFKALRSSLC